ncbi:hypothetical protein HYFRA_00012224 [Hymenoscyphus fraxineus]|uniref:Uncharacterized protein n=1 Tax=Hymenoscyphus fraxineus TaxID=746836 RepID=A0A9N9KYC3_9HELO|nr:hypothetical protein HYFRA_00012224 [Hymenoscyphus fraxineus]
MEYPLTRNLARNTNCNEIFERTKTILDRAIEARNEVNALFETIKATRQTSHGRAFKPYDVTPGPEFHIGLKVKMNELIRIYKKECALCEIFSQRWFNEWRTWLREERIRDQGIAEYERAFNQRFTGNVAPENTRYEPSSESSVLTAMSM